ncbi:MAG: hypothetical protein H6633_06505 [Anaerolineales bacterium]|nr:hypothetical protein [Anaerolineales bacterium]
MTIPAQPPALRMLIATRRSGGACPALAGHHIDRGPLPPANSGACLIKLKQTNFHPIFIPFQTEELG